MKPLLPFIPVLLLLLVSSCAQPDPPAISNEIGTAVALSQTAAAWTVTPAATFNPNIPIMVNWLNEDLASMANSLETTLDAKYSVTNISFPHVPNTSDLIFRVDVGCICMNSADCCIPERTFVVIVESMKRNPIANFTQVPAGVRQIMMVCSDLKTKSQIGVESAPWQDVLDYLQGRESGFQLGARVSRITAP